MTEFAPGHLGHRVDERPYPRRPGPLAGVRIVDLSWLIAGAGGSRFLAAMGAEVIRVEWKGNVDFLRLGPPSVYREGEEHAPLVMGTQTIEQMPSLNRNGFFNNVNPGKLGISLNLGHERGREILKDLVARSDILLESFSAGAMDKLGIGYEALREVKPDLVYVQASGFGKTGPRSSYLSFGPTVQALSGLTHQSGMPEREPAGWGFSYMDYGGAYFFGLAALMALTQKRRTGEGVYVDMAQAASAIFFTGTATLDHAVNGRASERAGNRSPHIDAAPHGAFPVRGVDRWIAIAVFDDEQWAELVEAIGSPAWAQAPELANVAGRLAAEAEIEAWLGEWTADQDGYALMRELQRRGVPAGVCQSAEDRVDNDLQLQARGYWSELPHAEMGTWPVEEVAFSYSGTAAEVGRDTGHAAPLYGEHTELVLGELLGMSAEDVTELREQGVC